MDFTEMPGVMPCFFKKGEILIKSGDPIESVYYLRKGTVYREIVTNSGVESILSCKESGGFTDSIVGILRIYGTEPPYISANNFVAGTDCSCLSIPTKVIKEYLSRHPELLEQLVGTAVQECRYLMNLYLGKLEKPAPAALCSWMLERLVRDEKGYSYLPPIQHNDIAKFLNLHKVTVSRVFGALCREGVLEKTKQGMVVKDMKRMRAYAENMLKLKYS